MNQKFNYYPQQVSLNSAWIWLVAAFILFMPTPVSADKSLLSQTAGQGFVDWVVVAGDRLIAQGWAAGTQPNSKVVSLSIWLADKLVYEGSFEQINRQDVAKAMNRNDWFMSGWRINEALPSHFKSGEYPVKVLAKLDSGMVINLNLPPETVSVRLYNYRNYSFLKSNKNYSFLKGVVIAFIPITLFVLMLIRIWPDPLIADNQGHFKIKKILCNLADWNNSLIIFLIILIVSLFSALIPPFQSPDEYDHIKRAYLLGEGQFILDAPTGLLSGGNIDSGLLQYMNLYSHLPFHTDEKVTQKISTSAQGIKWTGINEFSPAPGTGYYFPLAYAPQAVGLMTGKFLNLSVDASYRLARLMVLVSSVILLSIAFSIFPTNPLAIGLLIIPMSLFQLSSASLDAFTTSLSIFAISTFLRITARRPNRSTWLIFAHGISVFIIASCRTHLLPLLALPYFVYLSSKERKHLCFAAIISVAVFAWLFVAVTHTHANNLNTNVTTAEVAKYYLANPALFAKALMNTFQNHDWLVFYKQSFVGILGWIDTKFSEVFYSFVLSILIMVAIGTVTLNKGDWHQRLLLLSMAFISLLLIFFMLLVTWNPLPTEVIEGVQGRYFLVPLLLVSYALAGTIETPPSHLQKISIMMVIVLAVTTILCMPQLLLYRYFI